MHEEKHRGPGLTDIAADAGVSIATVSRVINASAYVKPDVALRVRTSITRLGYVRLRSARNAGGDRSPLVGLMLPDIENPYFASLIKGVQSVATTMGLDIALAEPGAEPSFAAESLARLIDRRVAAILVVAPKGFESACGRIDSDASRAGIPVVYMDRRVKPDGINFVGSENYMGACNAAAYLCSLGHRDILYLAGSRGLSTETERRSGFLDGLAAAGIRDSAALDGLFELCDFSLDEAYAAVRRRIATGLDFSAVFAADDYMAYGALTALREAGLRVPEDVSLVGFDDLPFSSMFGLTTVRQQAYEIGVAAITMALDIAAGRRKGPQSVILSTSLVIRGSCSIRAPA
jgi:LacI family transcriptional regulator